MSRRGYEEEYQGNDIVAGSEVAGGGGGGATAERGTREGRVQESWMLRSEPVEEVLVICRGVAVMDCERESEPDNEPEGVEEYAGDMQENEPEGGTECYLSLVLSFLNARIKYLR